jgi:hypothetical protein
MLAVGCEISVLRDWDSLMGSRSREVELLETQVTRPIPVTDMGQARKNSITSDSKTLTLRKPLHSFYRKKYSSKTCRQTKTSRNQWPPPTKPTRKIKDRSIHKRHLSKHHTSITNTYTPGTFLPQSSNSHPTFKIRKTRSRLPNPHLPAFHSII